MLRMTRIKIHRFEVLGCDAINKGDAIPSIEIVAFGLINNQNQPIASIRCAFFDNWLSSSIKYLRCM